MDFNSLDEHRQVNVSGRGLGLSICRNIIDKMGGTVHVKSAVNVGSTFLINLPAMYDYRIEEEKEEVSFGSNNPEASQELVVDSGI
jgi:K+-sensing histidine kinase KdpD